MAKTRERILNNLNRRRRRLIKKGAKIQDLKEIFTIDPIKNFGDLSTQELRKIDNRLNKIGPLTVNKKKAIVTVEFENRKKTLIKSYGLEYSDPSSYKKSLSSKLNKYESTEEIRKRARKNRQLAKYNYAKQVEEIGGKEAKALANKIKKMSLKNFEKMIKDAGGALDFDVIFYSGFFDRETKELVGESSIDDHNNTNLSNLKKFLRRAL